MEGSQGDDLNRTGVLKGKPTRWQIRNKEKEKENCKLGVCAIIKQLGGRQGVLIEGTGFLVKDFFPNFERKYHLVTSKHVIPSSKLDGYFLRFKKRDSTDKKLLELASVVNAADNFHLCPTSGLVTIPLDPGKLSVFGRRRSGLVNHRPFTASAEIQHQSCELYCHVVEEYGTSHVVKPYQLLKKENGQYYLRAFQQDCSRKLLGAPITTDVNGGVVAVGALTSESTVSPVFFSQSNFSSTLASSGRFIALCSCYNLVFPLFCTHYHILDVALAKCQRATIQNKY